MGSEHLEPGCQDFIQRCHLRKDFLPTNLRFGPSLTLDIDDYNSMSFMLDFNKLLVPTQPFFQGNSDTIIAGFNPMFRRW
jgi:hypothetical protein